MNKQQHSSVRTAIKQVLVCVEDLSNQPNQQMNVNKQSSR